MRRLVLVLLILFALISTFVLFVLSRSQQPSESLSQEPRELGPDVTRDISYKDPVAPLGAPSPTQFQVRGTLQSVEEGSIDISGNYGVETIEIDSNPIIHCYPQASSGVYLDFSRFQPDASPNPDSNIEMIDFTDLSTRVDLGTQVVALGNDNGVSGNLSLEYLIVYGCKNE